MEINKACSTPEGRQAPTPDGTRGDRRDLRLRGTRRTQKGASPAIPRCPAAELERLIRAESPGDAAGVAPVQTEGAGQPLPGAGLQSPRELPCPGDRVAGWEASQSPRPRVPGAARLCARRQQGGRPCLSCVVTTVGNKSIKVLFKDSRRGPGGDRASRVSTGWVAACVALSCRAPDATDVGTG